MRVSCHVVTSRRSRDRNAGFSAADDADARSVVFVLIQINTFTYLRKMSVCQTNSVYVNFIYIVQSKWYLRLKISVQGPFNAGASLAAARDAPGLYSALQQHLYYIPDWEYFEFTGERLRRNDHVVRDYPVCFDTLTDTETLSSHESTTWRLIVVHASWKSSCVHWIFVQCSTDPSHSKAHRFLSQTEMSLSLYLSVC